MTLDLNRYEAFVFDLDGTVIDSEKYHADGFAQAIEAVSGYRLTSAERREFFEAHTSTFTPVLSERHGLDLDPLEVLEHKRAHVREYFKADLFPNVLGFIEKWCGEKRMALASNSPLHFVKDVLEEAKIGDYFEVICTANDVTHRKPDPEMYLLTLRRLNLAPAAILVFEDSPPGVKAAQGAGCPVLMIENGSGRSVAGVEKYTWKELLVL